MIVKKNRYSHSYIGTVYHHTPAGQIEIAAIRKAVKAVCGQNVRVHLKGRLGPNNPFAWNYNPKLNPNAKFYNSYQNIQLRHAAYVDLYLYRR